MTESKNRKIGNIACTYLPIKQTYDIIRKEAREIASFGPKANGKPLRLHISGDARTEKTANLLRDAAKKWDGKVFTYTHAWRDVPRDAWGSISVLASIENLSQAHEAFVRGYVPAVTVSHHPKDGKAYYKNGVKVIPCPQQTKGVTCEQCKLCMNDSMLYRQDAAIAFAAHGVRKKKRLTVIQ